MLTPWPMSELAKRLKDKAAERRRVGWELSDAMLPGEMEAAASAIESAEAEVQRLRDQYACSQGHWIEAAETAIKRGDFRLLQLRVDLAKAGSIDFTETQRT